MFAVELKNNCPSVIWLNAAGAVNSSVLATCVVVYPPVAKAAVLIPEPKLCLLEVPRSAISVHDVPSQNSVIPVIPGSVSPPIAKAAVYAPAPPANCLSVFNSAISVQLVH